MMAGCPCTEAFGNGSCEFLLKEWRRYGEVREPSKSFMNGKPNIEFTGTSAEGWRGIAD